jgi:hypothetical protein
MAQIRHIMTKKEVKLWYLDTMSRCKSQKYSMSPKLFYFRLLPEAKFC